MAAELDDEDAASRRERHDAVIRKYQQLYKERQVRLTGPWAARADRPPLELTRAPDPEGPFRL